MAKNGPHARQRQGITLSPDPRKEQRKTKSNNNKNTKMKYTESDTGGLVFPSGDTAFKALLSARFCAAIWCNITDCDETFNYWEPTHYLVYGKGLQTWEYSPEYALRSYTYLLLHAAPTYIYQKLLQPNPLLLFYLIRCLLGLVSALAEVYFYKAVCREFGVHVGRLTFAFQLCSAGMFISSAAYLPSSWAMYLSSAAFAAWWQRRYPLAIFFTALSSLLGWPFAALLGVPIAVDMLFLQSKFREFVQWSVISAVTILGPMTLIDSMYYGKFPVIAPWNIIKYNIFTDHGPNLYGTEPLSYYLINGLLNFNIVWIMALLTPVALIISYFFIPAKSSGTYSIPYCVSLAPLYLWLLVFFIQPHKEERFLFPIYPMLCLCGAITTDILQKLWFRIQTTLKMVKTGTHYLERTTFIMFSMIILSSLFGILRILALYQNYHAPIDLMMELNRFPVDHKIPDNMELNLCIGKDWYRYPSSFFLPNNNWNVRFIKSEFKGILPAPYGANVENATTLVHSYFNNKNIADERMYFNITKCHFLLDLDLGKSTELEPNYSSQKNRWTILKSLHFINAEKSHRFFRAFYIPFLNDKYVTYSNFYLLQSTKQKFPKS